jgi:hypothetical protein
MDNLMQMTQIKHETLRAEADARRLAKLAQEGQGRTNHALSVGRIIQMVLVMLK